MAVFRVDKIKDYTVMSNHHLRNISLSMKAKGLMSLMLSLPDNWDYTLSGLATISTDGLSSIRAAVAELEAAGHLKRRRIRNDKGQLAETEYTILEQPESGALSGTEPICENPILENPMLDYPTLEEPMLENRTQLNTNISNKDLLSTDQSITNQSNVPPDPQHRTHPPPQLNAIDMMDAMGEHLKAIHENIEYAILTDRYGIERVDELVQLMLDAVCSRSEFIRIDRANYPTEAVKTRLLLLRFPHIEYVLDSMERTTTKIINIKSYLLTALYNAPTTMDSYYRAAVNHDFS